MSVLAVLKTVWTERETIGDTKKTRELAAFLPAALEIQEAPPNPITSWVGRILIALLVIFITWSVLSPVNIVASAEGKIIPSSRVKQIQPLSKAVVKKILVTEGQSVTKGQALVELDSTLTQADKQRLESELSSASLNLAINQSFIELIEKNRKQQKKIKQSNIQLHTLNNTELKINQAEITLHKKLLWQQWLQYQAQLNTIKSTLQKTQAEQKINQALIAKLEQTLPIITKRTNNMQDLLKKDYASETDYLALEQERIQQQQDLAVEKHKSTQLESAIEENQQQIKAFKAQTKTQHLQAITEQQRQIEGLNKEITKAHNINAQQILYSPVNGKVQELAISTIGGIVTDAQQLMLIVPDEEQLEVEVILDNKDIGFVHQGMAAEIKIHTFPFTKYGVINGTVTHVSNDARIDEQRGLIYVMQIKMDKNTIRVNKKDFKLIPGMQVTAEVQTGKRKIVEFFMAPLLKAKAESIRER